MRGEPPVSWKRTRLVPEVFFRARRIQWLLDQLNQTSLGPLLKEMHSAAEIPQSPAFRDVVTILQILEDQLALKTKETMV